ncbi:MAG TPA: alpha/beta hydrolase [Pseudolysinimonas sp.]|jgi:acetyl esterase
MQIDPLLVPVLANQPSDPPPTVEELRAAELANARAIAGRLTSEIPASVSVRDESIAAESPIRVRIYTPAGDRTRAALLFAHGGGWASGSVEAADGHCGDVAAGADVVVVSVEYRLIPEHPFPAGLDDVWVALNWLHDHAAELGVDPERLAIGGESAGANLAAVAAIRARDEGGPALQLELFEVAVFDLTDSMNESRQEILDTMPDFARSMEATRDRYLAAGADPHDPRVSPLLEKDLSGLPTTLLLAADVDPVRDDSVAYAARLTAAGVPARVRVFPGIVHGTESFTGLLPSAGEWLQECVDALTAI